MFRKMDTVDNWFPSERIMSDISLTVRKRPELQGFKSYTRKRKTRPSENYAIKLKWLILSRAQLYGTLLYGQRFWRGKLIYPLLFRIVVSPSTNPNYEPQAFRSGDLDTFVCGFTRSHNIRFVKTAENAKSWSFNRYTIVTSIKNQSLTGRRSGKSVRKTNGRKMSVNLINVSHWVSPLIRMNYIGEASENQPLEFDQICPQIIFYGIAV